MMHKSSECVEKVTRSTSPWYTELSDLWNEWYWPGSRIFER